jgi:hypothetical protein
LFTQDFYGFWVTAKKKSGMVSCFNRSRSQRKNMNKIVPIAMEIKDYLLPFLTKRIKWEILQA